MITYQNIRSSNISFASAVYKHATDLQIIRMHKKGYSSRSIQNKLFVPKSTVNDVLNRYGLSRKKLGPNLIVLDVESAPSIAAVFGRYGVNLSPEHILEEGGTLFSISWKVLRTIDSKTKTLRKSKTRGSIAAYDTKNNRVDDYLLCLELRNVLEAADFIIGHNIDKFDKALICTRMLKNGMKDIPTVRTIDTLKIARSLKFESNKLDSIGNYLELGRKQSTGGIALWIACKNGDKQAFAKMLKYNKQDVDLTTDVYLELRAAHRQHPNLALYYADEAERCPVCCSTDVEATGSLVFSNQQTYEEVSCLHCGAKSRRKQGRSTKEKRKKLLQKV